MSENNQIYSIKLRSRKSSALSDISNRIVDKLVNVTKKVSATSKKRKLSVICSVLHTYLSVSIITYLLCSYFEGGKRCRKIRQSRR